LAIRNRNGREGLKFLLEAVSYNAGRIFIEKIYIDFIAVLIVAILAIIFPDYLFVKYNDRDAQRSEKVV
jgi:hypothetical protein